MDMKKLSEQVLYFHDYMTSDEETYEEVRVFQREFHDNGLHGRCHAGRAGIVR